MQSTKLLAGVLFLAVGVALAVFGLWPQLAPRALSEVPVASVGPHAGGLIADPAGIDLGEVGQNQVVPFAFSLTNTTGRELRLVHVSKSCNCTEAEVERGVLQPGESTRVVASWKTRMSRGQTVLSVTAQFAADGGEWHAAKIIVKGSVKPDIEVRPDRIVFGRNGEDNIVKVDIVPGRAQLPTLVAARTSAPQAVSVTLEGATLTVRRLDASVPLAGHYVLVETSEAPDLWPRIPLAAQGE